MKKITLTYTKQSPETQWYATSSNTKTEAFTAMRNFVEENAERMEVLPPVGNTISVSIFMPDDKYAEYVQLCEAADPEINAYNSANNITREQVVEDE